MASKIGTMILALAIAPCFAQSNLLQITSPPNGTIVYPGQIVTISVSADPSVSNIAILAQDPLGFTQATNGHPLQFQLTIPSNTTIGAYDVGAMGTAPLWTRRQFRFRLTPSIRQFSAERSRVCCDFRPREKGSRSTSLARCRMGRDSMLRIPSR